MSINKINKYIEYVYQNNVSDLHLKAKQKPTIRLNGHLSFIDEELIEDDDIFDLMLEYCNLEFNKKLSNLSYDFSFNYKDVRFRVNVYHDINGFCASMRLLKLFSTDFSVLGLPEILKTVITKNSGLILFTGPTGSGKSTSLAAIVEFLNNTCDKHIITIEDPIEYVYKTNKCLITQREVGEDTLSFDKSISEAMRQDPDVLIVGEMRDKESIEAALVAAETGHLVFSTLHTRSAASTINRIIDMFESDKQNQILSQLSTTLLAILSQQLLIDVNGSTRHLATEMLIANNGVRSNIKSNKIQMVANMITIGRNEGMYTMKESVENLYRNGLISEETMNSAIE